MSRRVFRALAAGTQFATQLGNGASRLPSEQDVRDILTTHGLPDIVVYNRRVSVNGAPTKVLPDDSLFLLPEPVDPNDELGTELGGTFWGRTLSSTEPGWEIPDDQQPGIVAGVWRNDKPPMGIEVIADAIGLPVLANANLSFKADGSSDGGPEARRVRARRRQRLRAGYRREGPAGRRRRADHQPGGVGRGHHGPTTRRRADGPPPRAGAGSGTDAWKAYAASFDPPVEVAEDAKRDDVIAAIEAAGHPVE
jgi:hypothetical protein